jgi:arsenate reductase (thioredoxin)
MEGRSEAGTSEREGMVLPSLAYQSSGFRRLADSSWQLGQSAIYLERLENPLMLKILFLCTGNSCRSQMAEGWARHLKGDLIEPYSAGVEVHGMNALAVKVMAEAGIDISKQRPKHVRDLMAIPFDYVVTVCDRANETCPVFPGKTKRYHVGFDDPPKLAKHAKTEDVALPHYRRVRDEIRKFIEKLPNNLMDKPQPKGGI